MFQDLRYSLRTIAKTRASSTVVLLSLAFGTGVNAAVYGVVALGANRIQVTRLVFREAAHLAIAGFLLGAAVALAAARASRHVIEIPRLELSRVSGVAAALAIVIAIAAAVPLHRALRVTPNVALRDE